MERLRERLKFGKYVQLRDEPHGTLFNGRRLKVTGLGVMNLSMEEYIDSKLSLVAVSKDVKRNPEKALEDQDVEFCEPLS
eukprot:4745063-Amphidinium_carterae.5